MTTEGKNISHQNPKLLNIKFYDEEQCATLYITLPIKPNLSQHALCKTIINVKATKVTRIKKFHN